MTQEDKELLLKDLCARLPYGVKGIIEGGDVVTTPLKWYAEQSLELSINYMVVKNGWRPYLFPLSSMTEEQHKDLATYYAKDSKNIIDDVIKSLESPLVMYRAAHVCFNTLEWYNKNHFDYRGLIEKSLALDATGLNIY